VSLSAIIFMVLILGSYWIGFAVLLTIALRRGGPPDDDAASNEASAAQEHPQEPS